MKKLKEQMSATIERARAEDPRALRAEVARLTKERDYWKERAENDEVARTAERTKLEALLKKKGGGEINLGVLKKLVERYEKVVERTHQTAADLKAESERLRGVIGADKEPGIVILSEKQAKEAGWKVKPRPPLTFDVAKKRLEAIRTSESLTGPEQRILDALAWLESLGITEADQTAAAFLAGYSPRGGAFLKPRGRLKQMGLIDYRSGGRLALTPEGRGRVNKPQTPATPEELQARVLERLPGPEAKILNVLLRVYPKGLPNEELASQAGYAVGGSAYANPRGRLRTLGLIEYRDGQVAAKPLLFLEG